MLENKKGFCCSNKACGFAIWKESKLVLTDLLDRTMPKIKTLLDGKRSDEPTKDKLCDFVEEYIRFDNISKMSEEKFIKSYQKWAKKNRTQKRKDSTEKRCRNGAISMNFTVEETNLMCIYGTNSRTELIHDLEEMQTHLQSDEIELMELTKTNLAKLHNMSDDGFEKVQCELVADFNE